MFVFIKPGETYIKDGFHWKVTSIDKNLIRSTCIGHDLNDLEQLEEFNRQVVCGVIQVSPSCDVREEK